MRNPLCLLRTIWMTLRYGGFINGQFAMVSGHRYIEKQYEGQPASVQILECETCGYTNVCWSRCSRCAIK